MASGGVSYSDETDVLAEQVLEVEAPLDGGFSCDCGSWIMAAG